MIVALLAVAALADPVACDPDRLTPGPHATGFCLSEADYVALGRLRAQVADLTGTVAAREAELQVVDAWRAEHAGDLKAAIDEITTAGTAALTAERSSCTAELATARKRTPIERHGFVVGLVVGVGATVATTALVLQTYGAILGP